MISIDYFIENTLVFDDSCFLTLKEIMNVMEEELELEKKIKANVIHDKIINIFQDSVWKKMSGHKECSPVTKYSLRFKNLAEKTIGASILICVATDLEKKSMDSIVKMAERVEAKDVDLKNLSVGFSPNFAKIIAVGQPNDRGSIPMYGATKFILGLLPNLKMAFKSGSCSACLNMGYIVVGSRDLSGLDCRDPCSQTDWMVLPGLPSDSLIQASYEAQAIHQ